MGVVAREERLTMIAEVDFAASLRRSAAFSDLNRSCQRSAHVVSHSTYSPIKYEHSPDIIQLFLQHFLDSWYVLPSNCLFVCKLGEPRQLTNSEAMRVNLETGSIVSNIVHLDLLFFPSQIGFALVLGLFQEVTKDLKRFLRFIERSPLEELHIGWVHDLDFELKTPNFATSGETRISRSSTQIEIKTFCASEYFHGLTVHVTSQKRDLSVTC